MRRHSVMLTALWLSSATIMQPPTAAAQDPATPQPTQQERAVDPIQAQRYASLPKVRPWPIAWFQPQEIVRGSVTRGAAPAVTGHSIAPAALAKARDYAMSHESDALLVWRAGKLELAEWGRGAKPADQLNTYYMHFPVLSLLYGIAIADGKIGSVDDPVGKYIVEWRDRPEGKITLRNLLNMQSGLEVYHDSKDPTSKAARMFLGADSTTPALEYRSVEPQGQTFAYSYHVPEVLGIALERALGKERYADYLSRRLWQPLGNADAALWLDRPGGRPHFNSSLFATAQDWLNIGTMVLNNGKVGGRQVVPASWIKTMETPSSTNPNYGMLWLGKPYTAVRRYAKDVDYTVNASEAYAAPDLMFIDGYGGQRIYIVPSKQLVIVRIGLTRKDWDDSALPNAVLAGIK